MTHPEFRDHAPTATEPSTGELALEDRSALRRVAGLSTELTDVTEVEYRQLRLERVVLVGVWTDGTAADSQASMAELAALAETAGSQVLEGLIQRGDRLVIKVIVRRCRRAKVFQRGGDEIIRRLKSAGADLLVDKST